VTANGFVEAQAAKEKKQKEEMIIALRVLTELTLDADSLENKLTLQSAVGFVYVVMSVRGFL